MKQNKIKVLLVEDERMLAEILADTLTNRGMEITLAHDGEEGLRKAREAEYDVIVSDIMMPRMDGYTMVEQLRKAGITTPVMFLTARSTTEDVVHGFELGAADYLKKPFALDELIVRIRSLVGRSRPAQPDQTIYTIGLYSLDTQRGVLSLGANTIKISSREAEVLTRLVQAQGEVVTSAKILKELWGDDSFFNMRSLNVFISRLRTHLAADPKVQILNIRGVGYRLIIDK